MNASRHTEWLSLIEVSGPFLVLSVLEKAFPQGLESIDTPKRQHLRAVYDEWYEAVDENDPIVPELHQEWVRFVLREILEFDNDSLIFNSSLETPFAYIPLERTGSFTPDFIVRDFIEKKVRLFIKILAPGTDLDSIPTGDNWPVSIAERMIGLCRENDVRFGLITNGERWMLVNAPIGSISSNISWYARLWFQELVTLKAFQTLLGVRRFFGPPDETLEALVEESLKHHEEVTDTLGEQVRRAVEVLIQCLDKADEERNRELLRDVRPGELYEAGLTVMMRIVFILCAEERGLLLLGDPVYDQNYAISTLRSQLSEAADLYGPEVLDRRYDAWSRLLAVFRAVYGGIEHESLRMPALGGSLFDPDRFPFLEGRRKGSDWKSTSILPLPIDNRTVLFLLNSLQVLEQLSEALLLSYRALDVEQIGHIYEGLLEHTVIRIPEVTLGLVGSQKAKNPNVSLSQLESARNKGDEPLVDLLKEVTQRSESAIRNALVRPSDNGSLERLLSVLGGDSRLSDRIRPFIRLLRSDAWGDPTVYRENSFMVTLGIDRRETGTHYTPKSLTETIVATTLESVVYEGPSEGKPREVWNLKSSSELLELKVCDPAMGSGAFLVQACRWLAERLIDAWAVEEKNGKKITIDGEVRGRVDSSDPLPIQLDERLVIARRLIAEKCLYGVDINPLAVELSKLSLWLVTMAKGRPFGFLDHNLRHGDSILGIHHIDQLTRLSISPEKGQLRLFGRNIEKEIRGAVELRKSLSSIRILDIKDVETMVHLDKKVRNKLQVIEILADAMIGITLTAGANSRLIENGLNDLSDRAEEIFSGNPQVIEYISNLAKKGLTIGLAEKNLIRKPFHWPIEFPEVFSRNNSGFDAIIGNPPFIGGRRMRGIVGDVIMNWLKVCWPHASMNADYCSFFYLKSVMLLRNGADFGLLGTKTISQGDTARTGLSYLINEGNFVIRHAKSLFPWPGNASIAAGLVIGHKGDWNGEKVLDGRIVNFISPVLDDQGGWGEAKRLASNIDKSYQGSVLVGTGFILAASEAEDYLKSNPLYRHIILPYLNGQDLNSHYEQKASRWAIDFRDASLKECEKKWPELLARVRKLVKPQRDEARRETHRKYWWQHGDKRPALYTRIERLNEVFVASIVTKHFAIVRVPAKQIFSHRVYVFDITWSGFAALQCTFHDLWIRRGSSTVGERLNYTSTDYFDTYPFLHIENESLKSIGKKYHDFRKEIMISRNEGLTNIYNRFHDPGEKAEDIQNLRKIHIEMDKIVALSYGWGDLPLNHDFYDTKLGPRFSLPEFDRKEVLNRLLVMNNERLKEEIKHGLAVKKSGRSVHKVKQLSSNYPDLFDL